MNRCCLPHVTLQHALVQIIKNIQRPTLFKTELGEGLNQSF